MKSCVGKGKLKLGGSQVENLPLDILHGQFSVEMGAYLVGSQILNGDRVMTKQKAMTWVDM